MIYKSHRKSANGVINIDPVVFCRYGAEAAVNCPGVAALSEKQEDSQGQVPGVDAFLNEAGHIVMDIRIILAYGSNIKDTSEYLISRVSAYLESVTGFKADRINIYVDDVKFVYQEGIGYNTAAANKNDIFRDYDASEAYDDYVEYNGYKEYRGYREYEDTEDIWDDLPGRSYRGFKEYPDEYIFEDDVDVIPDRHEEPKYEDDGDFVTDVISGNNADILDSSGYIDLEKDEYRPLSIVSNALITSDTDWESSYDDIEEFFEAPNPPTPKMEETVSDLDVYERLIRNEDLKYGYGRGFVYPRYEFRSF